MKQVSGKYQTFVTSQITSALLFVPTHEWRISENVIVRFDRLNGRCFDEAEARWHFEFLNEAARIIEERRSNNH
jgi:hypothetical protein